MLWSLIKIVLFICVVAALTLGAVYLSETEGGIRIAVADTELSLGPLQAAIAFLALIISIWVLLKILSLTVAALKFLNGDETAISRYFDRNRERRGFEALSDGLMAIASGEGRVAMSKAAKAEKYLGRPELTSLITAQAAEMTGDKKKAEEVYKRLLDDSRTRFVGVHGLMKQKLLAGDTATAMKLAEHAFALKPKHADTGDVLLQLQAKNQDWSGARKTLGQKMRHGSLPRDVHKRRDAVLALSEAREIFRKGNPVEAREAAIEANRLSPDLIPAAVMAARSYIEKGKAKYAARVLKKAWDVSPHPDLAAAFASIEPQETAQARLKRFEQFIRSDPQHPEAIMLMAELQVGTEDYAAARDTISKLVENDPTARSLSIMAAIERGEGGEDAVVRAWLTKAVTASRGPQWVCESCQTVHINWAPTCTNCNGFDTLSWRLPVEGEVAMPESTEMLPLMVGDPVDDAPIPDDDPPETIIADAEIVEEPETSAPVA